MRIRFITLTLSVLVLVVSSIAFAHDFLGATVDDRDTPSDAFSAGIVGFRPIFHTVPSDSPAAIAGFQHGDIIMEVNGNKVKTTSDLGKYTSDTMSIIVVRGRSRKTLTIESKAFVVEKPITPEIEKHPASITTQQVINTNAQQDNSPPLLLNDAILEKKYGKTTPAELARQRQIAEQRARENRNSNANVAEQQRSLQNQKQQAEQLRNQQEYDKKIGKQMGDISSRGACPQKEFETWKDKEKREECVQKYLARQEERRRNPEKFLDELEKRVESAESAAHSAESAAQDAINNSRWR